MLCDSELVSSLPSLTTCFPLCKMISKVLFNSINSGCQVCPRCPYDPGYPTLNPETFTTIMEKNILMLLS